MSDQLRQSLSALMDNEADELELRRILQQANGDPELMDTWRRYHVVRAAMKSELPDTPMVDLSQRINAAIAQEAAPTASQASKRERSRPNRSLARMWSPLGKVAVAASVAAVVIWGAKIAQLNGFDQPASSSSVVSAPNDSPALSLPVSQQAPDTYFLQAPRSQNPGLHTVSGTQQPTDAQFEVQAQLNAYLKQHAEQMAASGSPGMIPLARVAGFSSSDNQ